MQSLTPYWRERWKVQLHLFLTSPLIYNINTNIFVGRTLCIRKVGFITSSKDTFLWHFRCYETSWFP